MKTIHIKNINKAIVLMVFTFLNSFLNVCMAQDSTAKSGAMNNTMKQVFAELKSGSEDSATGSIIMIIAIAAVVGVALYMSFKSDPSEKPKPAKK